MRIGIHTLKARLTLIFGALLIVLVTAVATLVFGRMKQLILEKHLHTAAGIAHIGTIPLTDAMLSAEVGRPLPQDYFDRVVRNLSSDSRQEILYTVFLDGSGGSVIAYNYEPEWTTGTVVGPLGDRIYKTGDTWVLHSTAVVGISTKVWGYLMIGFDASLIQTEVKKAAVLVLISGLAIILIMLVVVNTIAEQMTKRLNALSVAVGEFDYESDMKSEDLPEEEDEIGLLISRFNDLRRRLIMSRAELRESDRNLFHAEKLASIGRLAAGVAHEINNPLTGIRYSIANLLSDPGNQEVFEEYLVLIDEALVKIESVVSKLLGFSRRKGDVDSEASLNDALHTVIQLLDYAISSKKAEVKLELSEDLPPILCNPHLLDEIAMNLIINALDAVQYGGQVTCHTWTEDEGIVLEIKDDGHGISDEHMQYLFEPFFTTKEVGEGTGLGLYVTREIVQGLGGRIGVSSSAGSGAKFTVHFPRKQI